MLTRSIGAILDQRGMREITLVETDDALLLQGLALMAGEDRQCCCAIQVRIALIAADSRSASLALP